MRPNLRPARKRLAQKRATTSRPSYSKSIGGIETNTSLVRKATSASRSADSHARVNFATIASSAVHLELPAVRVGQLPERVAVFGPRPGAQDGSHHVHPCPHRLL